jgi:hypothetical protein
LPGRTHASGERYREDADRKSWTLFTRFLKERLQ